MPSSAELEAVRAALADGTLDDARFDALLPKRWRFASAVYWSPVVVARRVASWLEASGARRLLDIGSGPGKFCVLAALSGPRLELVGVEERPKLHEVAVELAERFEVSDRVRFHLGRLESIELSGFDAYYLYNPFGENLHEDADRLDRRVEHGADRYAADVARVEAALEAAPIRTQLLVFHGFGGRVPDSFDLISADEISTDRLCIFEKRRGRSAGGWWLEEDGPSGTRVPTLLKP